MELSVWPGDWGLPSVDISCLQAMSYAAFCGVPIKTSSARTPFWTPNGALPVLKQGVGNEVQSVHKFTDIVTHFRKCNYNADHKLSSKQAADSQAFTRLLEEQLQPAIQYIWWVDERNYSGLFRPWYAAALSLPFNYYYPGSYQRRAKDYFTSSYPHLLTYPTSDDWETVETAVYKQACECLTLLSNRLGESDYFWGRTPTSLDACVFAHLAPLLKAPLPNPRLQNHLKACTNLTRFISRILTKYFPRAAQECHIKKAATSSTTDDDDMPNKRRNQIISAVFAIAAMAGYAISMGILQINTHHSDDMFEDEEYEDFYPQTEEESEEKK